MRMLVLSMVLVSVSAFAGPDEDYEAARRQLREATEQLGKAYKKRIKLGDKYWVFQGGPRLGVVVGEGKGGVAVQAVTPGSVAEAAGLRSGDLVVAMDGEALTGKGAEERFVEKVRTAKVGAEVSLEVLRDGKKLTVKAVLPEASPAPFNFSFQFPHGERGDDFERLRFALEGPWSELELVAMNPDLGQYFGVSEGLLVVRAPADGSLKLKGGDVVLKIGDRVPKRPTQAIRILRSYEPGEKVSIEVMRQKQSHTFTVEMPGEKPRPSVEPLPQGGRL